MDVTAPLQAFNEEKFKQNYTNVSHIAPIKPADFKDAYLHPMLTSNEEKRLHLVWQHTHNLRADSHLMSFLQDTVSIAMQYFAPDCVIVGILDRDYYSRVSTKGCPLMDIPRREATCSHTVLQPEANGVFMLPDMTNDWRFVNSPHVVAGLRFYAGVPLRYKTEDTDVIFGSMCIAKYTPGRLLTELEQQMLLYLGKSVVQQIVSSAERRLRAYEQKMLAFTTSSRYHMSDLERVIQDALQLIRSEIPDINASIHKHKPEFQLRAAAATSLRLSNLIALSSAFAPLSLPICEKNSIQLRHGKWIALDDFIESAWYDGDVITGKEYQLGTTGHAMFGKNLVFPNRTVRALSVPIHIDGSLMFTLLIESDDLKRIYSRAEIAFSTYIASKITTNLQHYLVDKANTVKAQFLSSMSHEMRTPLHGILSASKLLQEETTDHASLSLIHTIEASSKNILGIVNNLIEFDKLESQRIFVQTDGPHSLKNIEQDVLDTLSMPDNISLLCDNRLPLSVDWVMTDQDLLKQCLVSVLQNAVKVTERGSVSLTTSLDFKSQHIIYDITDTGRGIPEELHERIFLPFTKLDALSAGSGLGLNISRRIAIALGGDLELISSEVGSGSHFRLRISYLDSFQPLDDMSLSQLTYSSPLKERQRSKALQSLLLGFERVGVQHNTNGDAGIIVMEDAPSLDYFDGNTILPRRKQVLVLLCEASGKCSDIVTELLKSSISSRIVVCRNPVGRDRVLETLKVVNSIYADLVKTGPPAAKKMLVQVPDSLIPASPIVHLSPRSDFDLTIAAHKKFMHKDLRALIVDDNSANRAVLVMYCKKRKLSYEIATNGAEAFDIYKNNHSTNPFNFILMDLQMPVCDGITATKNIREFERVQVNHHSSLILVVTGLSADNDKVASKEAGADGFYTKPVSIHTLDNVVKYHFVQ